MNTEIITVIIWRPGINISFYSEYPILYGIYNQSRDISPIAAQDGRLDSATLYIKKETSKKTRTII